MKMTVNVPIEIDTTEIADHIRGSVIGEVADYLESEYNIYSPSAQLQGKDWCQMLRNIFDCIIKSEEITHHDVSKDKKLNRDYGLNNIG